jgi:hypothetical protein
MIDLARLVKRLEWKPNTDYRTDGLIAGDHSGFWTSHKSDDFETWEWADPYGKTKSGFETQSAAIADLEAERAARVLAAIDTDAVTKLVEVIDKLRRVMFPIFLTIKQEEMAEQPMKDSDVILRFMGSGMSDMVTVGEFMAADAAATAALAQFKGDTMTDADLMNEERAWVGEALLEDEHG